MNAVPKKVKITLVRSLIGYPRDAAPGRPRVGLGKPNSPGRPRRHPGHPGHDPEDPPSALKWRSWKMNLSNLSRQRRPQGRRRVGRGPGSGRQKTSGRGSKGQLARRRLHPASAASRAARCPSTAGVPKRGFTNIFRTEYADVNLDRLAKIAEAEIGPAETWPPPALIENEPEPGSRSSGGARSPRPSPSRPTSSPPRPRPRSRRPGGQAVLIGR